VSERDEVGEGLPELFLLREVADIVEEMVFCRSPRPPRDKHAHPKTQGPAKEKCGQAVDCGLFCAFSDRSAGAAISLCAPELATMLGCWAAKNDMTTAGACAESAKALYDCMRTTVRVVHHLWFRL